MDMKLPFLPDEHHYAIASVAARSAQLDHHIELMVQIALLSHQNTAEFALRNLGADRVVGLLRATLLDLAPDQADIIEALVVEIARLRGERNEVMHWLWSKSDEDDKAIHGTLRPFRTPQKKTKTAKEVHAIAEGMVEVVKSLSDWHDLVLEGPRSTWLDKLSPQPPRPNLGGPLSPRRS